MTEEESSDLRKALEKGFTNVEVRCKELSKDIGAVEKKVIEIGTRWDEHGKTHTFIDKRLDGIEKRELEDAKGDATGQSTPQRGAPVATNGNGRIKIRASDIKSYLMIGGIIGLGIMSVWNLQASPSKEDLDQAQERIDSVAAAYEAKIEPTVKAATEVKKSQAEIRKLVELMNQALGSETLIEAEDEVEVMP